MRNHDSEDCEAVFRVNVRGVFNSMSAELRYMRMAEVDAGGGSIANLASTMGLIGKPELLCILLEQACSHWTHQSHR
jgi:NAD(P)-dependent dehydrogenase (short-subunit alcohol dehydrogenase family)